jgi:hypothetical protein
MLTAISLVALPADFKAKAELKNELRNSKPKKYKKLFI